MNSGGGGTGRTWLVEVTKGGTKDSSKEVLLRATADWQQQLVLQPYQMGSSASAAAAPAIKLLYIHTDGVDGVGEVKDSERRAAEALLRSFLVMLQHRRVMGASACMERSNDREHGLCSAVRRFHAERLYIAAKKKMFSKGIPQHALQTQAALPPYCLLLAVQNEKKLFELRGTGRGDEEEAAAQPSAAHSSGVDVAAWCASVEPPSNAEDLTARLSAEDLAYEVASPDGKDRTGGGAAPAAPAGEAAPAAQPRNSLLDELAAMDDDGSSEGLGSEKEDCSSILSSMGKAITSNRIASDWENSSQALTNESLSPSRRFSLQQPVSQQHSIGSSRMGPGGGSGSSNSTHFSLGSSSSLSERRARLLALGATPQDAAGAVDCRRFTPEQIMVATGGYAEANMLGRGSFGQVFRGDLLGCQVAVKRLEGAGWQGPEEFHMEVDVLSRMRHPHIVLLMGHCPEDMTLVYEYLPGGTLHTRLLYPIKPQPQGPVADGQPQGGAAASLPWSDRIRIASEVASALLYLHQNDPPIVHHDLKPDNILLDGNGVSKVGDVGLARLLEDADNVTMKVRGTAGYIDPEEVETCEISVASDVYAFGLIVLQLLTGQRHVKVVHRMLAEAWAGGNTDAKVASAVILKNLDGTAGKWPENMVAEVAEVALMAAQRQRVNRPTMADVVHPRLMELAKRAQDEVKRRKRAADSQFICPLSKEVMEDPVVAADGFTYEREHIEKWIASSNLSPCTGLPLVHTCLTPNNTLKTLISVHKSG